MSHLERVSLSNSAPTSSPFGLTTISPFASSSSYPIRSNPFEDILDALGKGVTHSYSKDLTSHSEGNTPDYVDNVVKSINANIATFVNTVASSQSQYQNTNIELSKEVHFLNVELERMRERLFLSLANEKKFLDDREEHMRQIMAWSAAYERLSGNNLEGIKMDELSELIEQQKNALSKSERVLASRIDRLKEEKLCNICMENEKNILIFPCKHFKICEQCSAKDLKLCPFCNVTIESTMKLFL